MRTEDLQDKFTQYAKEDIEGALQLITGLFVGLNEAYCEIRGDQGDGEKKITITGQNGQRKITIHPLVNKKVINPVSEN